MSDQRTPSHRKQKIMLLSERSPAWDDTQIEMVGVSAPFEEMKNRLMQAAAWNREPVLLIGERGSGKELAARALHRWSARRGQPFVPVLVPALCESLLADELFGHKDGSFTGAQDARLGRFASANGGTIFFDEIGDLSSAAQAAMLRIMETGEVMPVGEDSPQEIDVRIVAATNQHLPALIKQGRFRPDLYDRLRAFEIRVPTLRERREDIPLLASHFLKRCCLKTGCPVGKEHPDLCQKQPKVDCVTAGFYEALMSYDWPGNVRELRNLIIRLRAYCPGTLLEESHLQIHSSMFAEEDETSASEDLSLETAIRRHIESVLSITNHNLSQAARKLHIARATLYDQMRKLGIKAKGR